MTYRVLMPGSAKGTLLARSGPSSLVDTLQDYALSGDVHIIN
jgi:hypothetical protein